jgi:myo-inositol-1(or 4)-monophosphatase
LPDADRNRTAADVVALLADAVRDAGALALKTFRASPKQWPKGESSVVCEADIAVDRMLRDRLTAAAPEYGWLSEETEDDPARLSASSVWIVDPIDGTRSYLAGRDDWVIAAALARAGRPVAAAVFAPVTDELFLAAIGAGAIRNGAPIRASRGGTFAGAKFAGPKRRLDQLAAIAPGITITPRIGSLALRLTRVATGELDGAIAGPNSHDWDLAAADLLVHEAGGALTTIEGDFLTYNRPDPVHGVALAAGLDRHAMVLALARERPDAFA